MLNENDVLKYTLKRKSNSTVKRHYSKWRIRNKLPDRCDIPECIFHQADLIWNNKQLTLILDHVDGNNDNNRHQNLRYLCPNCNSQQDTQGGKNKDRVQNKSEMSYQIKHRDQDRTDVNIFPKPLEIKVSIGGQENNDDGINVTK